MLRLKEIREELELKQIDISNMLGVKRGTYATWEAEVAMIPIKQLVEYCKKLSLSIDYVLKFSNDKNYPKMSYDLDYILSGTRLKTLRKEKNYTQMRLAKITNVSYGMICEYEKGHFPITTNNLYNFCTILNISADYLLGKIDKQEKIIKPTFIIS